MVARSARRQRHRGDVRAGIGLGQREGSDRLALRDARQIIGLEFVRSCKRDRRTAKALHREGEVRKPAMTGKRLAGDDQIKRLQRIVGPAVAGRDAMPKPPRLAERAHPLPTSRINVVMTAIAAFHIGHRLISPLVELLGKGAVLRVKKRNAQMRGSAHAGSPGRKPLTLHASKAITIPTANHCIFHHSRQTSRAVSGRSCGE